MDKMKLESVDLRAQNVDKLAQLFPSCITESAGKDGALKRAVDFDKLRELLADQLADGPERYDFTWVGKRAAVAEAHAPIRKTLRPCVEESRDWDTTQNLYIEGDNLDVLKLLQESYLGKVKMIYIDPPYNTGSDSFVYPDNFRADDEEYDEKAELFDEDGNRTLRENNDSNPRFHSDWCSMIYSRLLLAQNLLSNDGAIFISIDDNELSNLIKICNEVFSENNFVGCICRATGTTTGQDANKIGSSLDYCLVYSKSNDFSLNGLGLDEKDLKRFNGVDEKGNYSVLQLRKTGNADTREDRPNMFYPIVAPDNSLVYPFGPTGYLSRWRVGEDSYKDLVKNKMIEWKKGKEKDLFETDGYKQSSWVPYVKYYLEGRTKQVSNLFQDIEGNKKGSLTLKELFGLKGVFNNPKPVEFLYILTQISTNKGDTVLDFFSGSGTTAHAVMQYNMKLESNRKFILVQIPEKISEDQEAYKAGYKTICEIGKERIRRAGDKIKSEAGAKAADLDIGFRVLKVDDSNMKDVYFSPNEISQKNIPGLEDNIKKDRNDLDLLFGCVLDWGLPLSLPYKSETLDGYTFHSYNGTDLIACFEPNVPERVVTAIAKRKPLRVVFRDSCFEDSPAKINVTEIFKRESPDTTIKTI